MIMKANNGDDEDFDGDSFDNEPTPLEPIFWIRPMTPAVKVRRFDQPGPYALKLRLQSDFARKYLPGQ